MQWLMNQMGHQLLHAFLLINKCMIKKKKEEKNEEDKRKGENAACST